MGRDQEEFPLKDADDKQDLVVPVIGEEIVAGTKPVKTGAVPLRHCAAEPIW